MPFCRCDTKYAGSAANGGYCYCKWLLCNVSVHLDYELWNPLFIVIYFSESRDAKGGEYCYSEPTNNEFSFYCQAWQGKC